MRVALVCPYALGRPGGVQSHVEQLARHLRQAGDTVLVVAPGAGRPGHVERPADGGVAGGLITVGRAVGVPFNDSVAPVALTPAAAARTLGALRAFDPDVVHVHEPAVPAVSLAATLRGPRPVVATFHAWSDRDRLYRLARPVLRPAVERLAARAAVSPAALAYHSRALALPAGSFTLIPNGVDVEVFAAAEPHPDLGDGPTLLFVGRLERRKGLAQLCRAYAGLRVHHPDLRLLVVGDGPERRRCEQALPAEVAAGVTFLGRLEAAELPALYACADVVVAPSLGGESFGVVLLEAMAARRPVVASDIPGYRTVLRDGVEGRLVPPGDVGALEQALDALIANPSLRQAMAAEAATSVAAYDWGVLTGRVREVYRSVTGGGT